MSQTFCSTEYGTLREALVCPPDHFQWFLANAVARETVRQGRTLDPVAVRGQYGEFIDALKGADVIVREVGTDAHLRYQTFTRDPGVVFPWGLMVCQMFRQERRGETVKLMEFAQARGLPVWKWPSAGAVEGGDIHLVRPGKALIGYSGERTSLATATQISGYLAAEGWEARLHPFAEHFLHMDLLFAVAAEGLALACVEVLEDDILVWLRGIGYRLIPVTYKEAMQLQNNVLALGRDRVLSSSGSPAVNAKLRAEGLTVLDPDLTLYTAGGGGPRCMTMPIVRD